MKKKYLFVILLIACSLLASAKQVGTAMARQVANNYFAAYTGRGSLEISSMHEVRYNGITTYYIFNYQGGGFVVVSADDAVEPVLAQSDESYIDENPENPSLRSWFDDYNRQIAYIVTSKFSNTETQAQWQRIIDNKETDSPKADIVPLLNTTWDQGQNYNYYCPTAAGGPGGKCWTGCVATAMGQIMKFYNFPAKGALSHTYTHIMYGQLSSDFGNTTYDFASMGAKATASSYAAIARLLYDAGVAVNMDYNIDGSGAYSSDVAWALSTYFNYDGSTIKLVDKSDFTNADWKTLIKNELTQGRPVYYSGSGTSGGHAWVCDGYRSSDDKYHMNWGWSGTSDGYFVIGSLNTSAGAFNSGNQIICGIKPGNADMIPRFTNLGQFNTFTHGDIKTLSCKVYGNTPTSVKIYLDEKLLTTSEQAEFSYDWLTSEHSLGSHKLRIEATNGATTASQELVVGLTEWRSQASGFTSYYRGINYLDAVDASTVWAIAYDGVSGNTINEFTITDNGGQNWNAGSVVGGNTYGLGNICGLDKNTAFVSLYSSGDQDNSCGIYKTSNGGKTWTHLTGALQGANSFADNVWFWNQNEGMCHGDVKDNYFEIYTTSNGGSTWTRVQKNKIGNGITPASGEAGWTSVITTCGDSTVAFGTNKGNVYISNDRGRTWQVSSTGIIAATNGGINCIAFKDKMNGLAAQTTGTTTLKSTSDGGVTWTTITPAGPFLSHSIAYVPGTANTYVSSGSGNNKGLSYSFDGGLTWTLFAGTDSDQFLALDFVDNQHGWAGNFNENASEKGVFKYMGILQPAASNDAVTNLTAVPLNGDVDLAWSVPAGSVTAYHVFRNDTLIATVQTPQFHDQQVASGAQNYCVSAVYPTGESSKTCILTWITLNLQPTEEAAYKVFPNPASAILNVVSPIRYDEVRLVSSTGLTMYRTTNKGTNARISLDGLAAGLYVVQIIDGNRMVTKKVAIRK